MNPVTHATYQSQHAIHYARGGLTTAASWVFHTKGEDQHANNELMRQIGNLTQDRELRDSDSPEEMMALAKLITVCNEGFVPAAQ